MICFSCSVNSSDRRRSDRLAESDPDHPAAATAGQVAERTALQQGGEMSRDPQPRLPQ